MQVIYILSVITDKNHWNVFLLTAAFPTNQWMNVVAGLILPGLPGPCETKVLDGINTSSIPEILQLTAIINTMLLLQVYYYVWR